MSIGIRAFAATLAVIAASVPLACMRDVVLPGVASEAVCGNGAREAGEACDVSSPGCVQCTVLPNWICSDVACNQRCGDGVVGDGEDCLDAHRAVDCDMTGYWAVRETNYARDAVIGAIQTSSNWFVYRLEQQGDAFTIRESIDCGVHVTGSVTVDTSELSARALLYANRMDGKGPRPARGGISKLGAGGCELSLERWYRIRGLTDDFLPADFTTKPPLTSLPALPVVTDPVNGTETPAGTVDQDGDGVPGLSFRITGFVTGVRNSAQRDWKEFATSLDRPVTRGALALEIPGAFELEESVLRVSGCGTSCGLMASPARSATDVPGKLALVFIGIDPRSPRVQAVLDRPLGENVDSDLATCANVRALLPHQATP